MHEMGPRPKPRFQSADARTSPSKAFQTAPPTSGGLALQFNRFRSPRLVELELSDKLDTEVTLSFDALYASDITGRARAFQSMVGGGMDVAKAAALSRLMMDEAA